MNKIFLPLFNQLSKFCFECLHNLVRTQVSSAFLFANTRVSYLIHHLFFNGIFDVFVFVDFECKKGCGTITNYGLELVKTAGQTKECSLDESSG